MADDEEAMGPISYLIVEFPGNKMTGEGFPILVVSRNPNGDWTFLCGKTDKKKDTREVLLGEVLDYDERVAEVADLPVAWRAFRDAPDSPWMQVPLG